MKQRKRKNGFTLVEILIVVIILGILAAIVIPQFTDASTDAKNSSLESNLQALRSQLELYKVQHNDLYPWDDGAGGIEADALIISRLTSKTDADGTVDAAGDFGPYMQSVPTNPFLDNATAAFATAPAADIDWAIAVGTGAITDGRP